MKKLICVLCMTLILIFAFVMVSFASDVTFSTDFGQVTLLDNMPTIAGIDTGARVVLKNSDGTYTTYPTYYIMKNSTTFGTDYANINANNKLGQAYDDGSMVLIEIPDGVTQISDNLFGMDSTNHKTTGLERIVILSDDYETIKSQTFRRMPSVKSVTISKSVTSIIDWGFCGSTALEEVIFEDGSLVETIGNSFQGCTKLSSINLEACTSLKSIGSIFNGCTSLRKIALPDSLETIGDFAFYRIGEFEFASDYLPKSLKSIKGHFLSGCKVKNEVLYFPEGFSNFDGSYHFNDDFKPNTEMTLVFLGKMTFINLENVALTFFTSFGDMQPLKLVFANNSYDELNGDFVQCVEYNGKQAYISKHADGSAPYTAKTGTLTVKLCNNDPNSYSVLGTDANGNTVCQAQGAPSTLIFCGGDKVEYCYSVRNNHTDKGWYRFFTTELTYDLEAHKTANVHYVKRELKQEVNCGYDGIFETTCVVCDLVSQQITPATGDHVLEADDFNCTTERCCTVCEKTVIVACAEHNVVTVIAYENGFFENGVKETGCKCEGCNAVNNTEETKKLFVWRGYAKPEYAGTGAVLNSFGVNRSAIDEYNEHNEERIESYGVTAALASKVVDGDIFASNTGVKTDYFGKKYDIIEMKVSGLVGENSSLELYITAYVVVGGKSYYANSGVFGEKATDTVTA